MVFAKRGVGKTHYALGIAVAVASGGTFLRYKSPKPRRVLYIDGEMPPGDLMRRLRSMPNANGIPSAYLQILSASSNLLDLPDLTSDDGRAVYTDIMKPFDFIILDNLSSLSTMHKENDSDSWAPIQKWLLRLRGQGKSVMLVHHGGKSGGQRGTSRKEDVLDTVIELAEPPGKTASAGAVFEVHLSKARSCYGKDAGAFKAQLSAENGAWTVTDIGQDAAEAHARVRQLQEEGKTLREIAEIMDLSKSKVGRIATSGSGT
jgi:putative DNA primase/helicase